MSLQARINWVSRIFYISAIALLFTVVTPYIAAGQLSTVPIEQAQYISKISESNPYQSLTYVLALVSGLCIMGMAYLYNQQQTNLKDQFVILKDISNNMANLSNKIENNQEIIEKSLDIVNNKLGTKPCLLDGDMIKELIKR